MFHLLKPVASTRNAGVLPFQFCLRIVVRTITNFHYIKSTETMSPRKHLKKGDAEPSIPTDGKLHLLAMRFCPYAQRIHLVLDAKRIPYETSYINLSDKPEWLTKYSQLGNVPALGLPDEPDAPYLVESLIVADYLDAKYPGVSPLHPSDPLSRAQDRFLVERFGALFGQTVYKLMTGVTDENAFPALLTGLDAFEAELKKRGTVFFGGASPGMIDLMMWPFNERIAQLKPLLGDAFAVPEERYPSLTRWTAQMIANEAVQKSYLPGEVHANFMTGRNAGAADYDMVFK